MPQITRIRFDSVGHPNARLDDLILDFRGADGAPTDTAVWLENGGGKSSMLNLFFSVVQPNARQFLGTKAGEKIRTLDHYVAAEDRSVITIEWEMESAGQGGVTLFGEHPRLVTGVFIERGLGEGEEGKMRRLFFSFRVVPTAPDLTLEGLPVFDRGPSGETSRWKLAGFRSQLAEARTRVPAAQLFYTESQREWGEYLDRVGIDTEIFSYQIQMNLREGGAADLFQFRSAAEFVDFFLKMVQDGEMGEGLARTIFTYRDQLKNRQESMLPECDLVQGMIARFRNLLALSARRSAVADKLGRAAAQLSALREWAQAKSAELTRAAQAREAQAESDQREADEYETKARKRTLRRIAVLEIHAEREVESAEAANAEAGEAYRTATRTLSLWKAAGPLARAQRERARAEHYEGQLESLRQEAAPLLARVQTAARAYAAALDFRIARSKAESERLEEIALSLDQSADDHREAADGHRQSVLEAKSKAEQARAYLGAMEKSHRRLTGQGDVRESEAPRDACARWEQAEEEATRLLTETVERAARMREEEVEAQRIAKQAEAEHRDAEQAERGVRGTYERADAQRRPLEQNETLLDTLQVETLSLDELTDASLHRLREARDALQAKTYRLWSQKIEAERVLHQIDNTQLLPPSAEVEEVLRVLRPKVKMAVAGWEYIETNISSEGRSRREFVEKRPHLAAGVIVRDADYEEACRFLAVAKLELDAPVVLAPQSAATDPLSLGTYLVVGPSHEGHFRASAAAEERTRRGGRLESVKRSIEDCERRLDALRSLLFRLEEFRAQYPRGWFAQQQERVEDAARWSAECHARSEAAVGALDELKTALAALAERKDRLQETARDAGNRRFRIETHLSQYPDSDEERRAEVLLLEEAARAAEILREQSREMENASRRQAAARRAEAAALAQEQGSLGARRSSIEHAAAQAIAPEEGDIPLLASSYESLRGQYAREVSASGLEQSLRDTRAREQDEMVGFRRVLTKDISEADVEQLLGGIVDTDRVEELRSEAEMKHSQALSATGNAAQAVNRAHALAKSAAEAKAKEAGALDLPYVAFGRDDVPTEPVEVTAWLAEEADTISSDKWFASGLASQASEGRNKAAAILAEARAHEDKVEQIDSLKESYGSLFARMGGHAPVLTGWQAPADLDAFASRVLDVRRALLGAKEEDERLDEDRGARVDDLIAWIEDERFQTVVAGHTGIRHIRSRAPAAMERDAAELLEQLSTRLDRLRDALASIDEHRETLIDQALAAGERGIHLLEAAERQSRLPGTMPRFGGRTFLKVSLPDLDPMARRTRMASLIDEVTSAAGEMPSGEKLLQMAVRRLAEPVKVSVLFPDPARRIEYIPVERLGAESGGEKLTSAILLYCTLVQMRARQRGTAASGHSTLLLDNPFGTASRVSFLEVQIETARAAGVQLIYTTGVKDYEAIATFPNINRLRPAGYDPVRGETVLERIAAESSIAIARLAWSPAQAAGPSTSGVAADKAMEAAR